MEERGALIGAGASLHLPETLPLDNDTKNRLPSAHTLPSSSVGDLSLGLLQDKAIRILSSTPNIGTPPSKP